MLRIRHNHRFKAPIPKGGMPVPRLLNSPNSLNSLNSLNFTHSLTQSRNSPTRSLARPLTRSPTHPLPPLSHLLSHSHSRRFRHRSLVLLLSCNTSLDQDRLFGLGPGEPPPSLTREANRSTPLPHGLFGRAGGRGDGAGGRNDEQMRQGRILPPPFTHSACT